MGQDWDGTRFKFVEYFNNSITHFKIKFDVSVLTWVNVILNL